MRPLAVALAAAIAMLGSMGLAQHAPTSGPYKVLKTAKTGGEGGFDYISADVEARRSFPTDLNVDTVGFNPATMEAIATAGGGTMIFVKENSPTSFEVEQRLKTMVGARNMVLDTKTNHIISMAFEYGPVPPNAPAPVPGRMQLGPPLPGLFTILMVGKQ